MPFGPSNRNTATLGKIINHSVTLSLHTRLIDFTNFCLIGLELFLIFDSFWLLVWIRSEQTRLPNMDSKLHYKHSWMWNMAGQRECTSTRYVV
jgi:hypothetical protein